ncbi:MAG: GntR family transcriptional regulator [Cryobacterium sp.]|nr:GntR family transcriptional regulator [Cryobacterium sp.]
MRASDTAYAALRDDILQWKYPPGTAFAEVEQATRLSISRTPIREAFARLTAEGLLVALPGRGLVVSDLSRDTIVELFELRVVLESEAARLVALRRDRDTFERLREEFAVATELLDNDDDLAAYYALVGRLDTAMDAAADSSFLVAAIRQLRPHLVRARRLARDNHARLVAAAAEHLTIVEAIVDGDAQLAADATAVHLKKSLKNILDSMDASSPSMQSRHES